eukprot:scaffold50327_cov50-Attheya_sp.AAC.4
MSRPQKRLKIRMRIVVRVQSERRLMCYRNNVSHHRYRKMHRHTKNEKATINSLDLSTRRTDVPCCHLARSTHSLAFGSSRAFLLSGVERSE